MLMRTSGALVLGAIIGAVVMWRWGWEIEMYVGEKAGNVLDRGGETLRRANDFLEETKADVNETFRTGPAAMDSAPAA
jgi:hypothetical protein